MACVSHISPSALGALCRYAGFSVQCNDCSPIQCPVQRGCIVTEDTPAEHAAAKNDAARLETLFLPKKHPELVIGLVGPVGVDLAPVIKSLEQVLREPGYTTRAIQLSLLIDKFIGTPHKWKDEYDRIRALMDEGTSLREKTERGDAVALLAIAEIKRIREDEL